MILIFKQFVCNCTSILSLLFHSYSWMCDKFPNSFFLFVLCWKSWQERVCQCWPMCMRREGLDAFCVVRRNVGQNTGNFPKVYSTVLSFLLLFLSLFFRFGGRCFPEPPSSWPYDLTGGCLLPWHHQRAAADTEGVPLHPEPHGKPPTTQHLSLPFSEWEVFLKSWKVRVDLSETGVLEPEGKLFT